MVKIAKVETKKRGVREGIAIEWEMMGFSEVGAKMRARMATASRFPTTVATAEILGVREFGEDDYNVIIWIPTDGFMSAGIDNPVDWLERNFRERFMG